MVAAKCEVEKIHDVAMVETIHHIAEDPAGNQPEGNFIAQSMNLKRAMKDGNHAKRDNRDGGENQI